MKSLTATVIFFLSFLFGNAQIEDSVRRFRNVQEQEDYLAKTVFVDKNLKAPFEKYKGKIVKVNNHTFTYGDKTLIVGRDPAGFQVIFETGIFHPGILFGDGPAVHKTAEELSKMSDTQRVFYNFLRNDTATISDVQELKFLRTPTSRKFRLLVWHIGSANPMDSFMELTNFHGRKNMPTKLFIKGAVLTFFKEYSILI
jgi:hypothetical protein